MEIHKNPPVSISTIKNVTPLDLQYGVKDKLEVPKTLESYFNSKESNQYVLIDASAIEQFPTLAEMADADYEILLGQSIQKQFRQVATYLIDITHSKNLLTWLFTQSDDKKLSWCLAESKAGVFFQSPLRLKELSQYFRKFTRIRDIHNKWRYFRFADPSFFSFMVSEKMQRPEYLYRWFYKEEQLIVNNYATYNYQTATFTIFSPTPELAKCHKQQKPFVYDNYFEQLTSEYQAHRFVEKITNILQQDYKDFYKTQLADLDNFIIEADEAARQLRLKSELARGQFALASILVGRILGKDDLKSVGFYSQSQNHENRKTRILLNQVIHNIQRRNLTNGN